jgi:allantoinase
MSSEWTIRSRRAVLPEGISPATIRVRNGVIQSVESYRRRADEDAGDLVIMPGLVDTHVHINEPGRTEWEGFASVTRAAAAGGITTVIDMPLNSIPATTSVEALQTKIAAANGQCYVDVGFWGGAIPGNGKELNALFDAGCFGFKCFLSPSGVEEFPALNKQDLREVMCQLSRLEARLLVHAELPEFIQSPPAGRRYLEYMNSRPKIAEDAAIELLLKLSSETGCPIHIVHLSSADSVQQLRIAREQGARVSVETCPHYLTLRAEEIPDGATGYKCAPPIREGANCEALWDALRAGVIDMVVSDHSPCPLHMKKLTSGDFQAAWGGISSLQLTLPVLWTEASRRGFTEADVVRWMSTAPADMARLSGRKGRLSPGYDADLVVWDPSEKFTVDASRLKHRHTLTPYTGRRLRGVVKATYVRGQEVLSATTPSGALLRRPLSAHKVKIA